MTTINETYLEQCHTGQLVSLYNDAAFELGRPQVNRFSDRATATKRVLAIVSDRDLARREAGASKDRGGAGDVQKHDPKARDGKLPPPKRMTEAESREQYLKDSRAINPEGVAGLVADAIQAQPEQAPVTSPAKSPRWARPKEEKPSNKAFRPRPGTSQAAIYDLLVRPEGTTMEEFCETMNKTLKPGTLPWTPPTVWGPVRYLFCAGKGYGLRFDGQRLWLLVPKNEVMG